MDRQQTQASSPRSSNNTRLSQLMATTPLCTRSILMLCLSIYCFQVIFEEPRISTITIQPKAVLYRHEFHRMITSAFFHLSVMHIAMNSMSTLGVGKKLENKMGTLHFTITVLFGVVLTSTVYIFIAFVGHLLGEDHMMNSSAAGFSGVLFQLSVLEAYQAKDTSRDVYGLFTVPTKAYPWALLVVLQIIIPNISFLGHLSGILVGTFQLHGLFHFIMPSHEFLGKMETWSCMRTIVQSQGFIPLPPSDEYSGGSVGGISGVLVIIYGTASTLITFLRNVLETLLYCLFGYQRSQEQDDETYEEDLQLV